MKPAKHETHARANCEKGPTAEEATDRLGTQHALAPCDRIAPDALLVACDPGGVTMDSSQFASWLQDQREQARSVAFVIGGAHGLGEPVLGRSARRLSLAPWTLPHEVARFVLSEQLYRAGTIMRGEPYHK